MHVITLFISFFFYISVSEAELFFCEAQNRSFFSQTETKPLNQKATANTSIFWSFLFIYLWIQLFFCNVQKNNHAYIHLYSIYIYPHIHTHISADLRKGSLRHSSNYYIRDIWKMPKMTKFHMLLYYHEHVSLAWCHQSNKCIWLYLKCCKLSVVMATIRSLHLRWVIMKSGSLQLPIIRLRKHNAYTFISIYTIK